MYDELADFSGMREYLKEQINEKNNKNIRELLRHVNKFKKGFKLRTNLVKENG
jgi:hypothetical protein